MDDLTPQPTDVPDGEHAGPGDERTDDAAMLADLVRVTVAINQTLRVGDGRWAATVDAVVRVAADLTGFDAGLLVVRGGRLEPQATTGRAPHELDELQDRLGRGPCVDAASSQDVVVVRDTAGDGRWGEFGSRAASLGVASMLCVPLWVDERAVGAISLYADRTDAFGEQHRVLAQLCGTLAAAALADAERGEHLRRALERRDVIGQAKGVLMATHKITAATAFDQLRMASQGRNEKLWAVASSVCETGMLPPVPARPRDRDGAAGRSVGPA